MSERLFSVTMTEAERISALFGLSFLRTAAPHSAVDATILELTDKLTKARAADFPPGDARPGDAKANKSPEYSAPAPMPRTEPPRSRSAVPTSGTSAARAVLASPALVDYFATTKKGERPTEPWPGVEEVDVAIVKVEFLAGTTPRLKVSWAHPRGRGFASASCFDTFLFPKIEAQVGKMAHLFIKANGNYTNVVGVRA